MSRVRDAWPYRMGSNISSILFNPPPIRYGDGKIVCGFACISQILIGGISLVMANSLNYRARVRIVN